MMKSRILSIIIAVAYLVISYFAGGGEALWRIAVFLILPLACIWFGSDMGGYTGLNFYTRPAITQTTPGCFVAFAGWMLLLLPGILLFVIWLTEKR